MRHVLAIATLALLPLSVIVAQTTTNPAAKKKTTTTAKRRGTTTSKKSSTAKKAGSKSGSTAASRPTYRPPSRARQTQPTPERYKEIQTALASKGYLKSEPTGTWNQESADALRRFQQDQNINASGKIDSLSLIALGLGPKRAANPTPPPPSSTEPKPEPPPPAGN